MSRIFVLGTALLFILSCSSDSNQDSASESSTRTFYLGFTPWPYEATLAAQDEIYGFIDSNADLIAHHLDGGIPWPEAFTADNFNNYGTNVRDEINGRITRTTAMNNKVVYLGVSPFNSLRDSLALYWNNSTGEALPSPWDTYDFGDSQVLTAYLNYMRELIDRIDPAYVNYAIEANEYYHNVPAERSNLESFLSQVYSALKTEYPDITFMISFAMSSPDSTKMQDTANFFSNISSAVDMIGISIYPYAFFSHADKGDPANLPSNWLSQIQSIAPNVPYFIAETGYLGESLSIPAFSLDVTATEEMQDEFVNQLFIESRSLNVQGIVWFSAYDFDRLWNDVLGDDLSLIWRDTGLKDGDLNDRQALDTWQTWFDYSRQ